MSQATFMRLVDAAGLYPAARALRIWLDHHTPSGKATRARLRGFYSRFASPGDLCFDIGANVGDRTELLLEAGARVVSVEPQPGCLGTLRRRLGRHPRCRIVEQAVGAAPGTAELHVCRCNPGLSTLSSRWMQDGRHAGEYAWNETVRVPVTTLDALIREYGVPRFCKIDVEGFEPQVLAGLSQPIPWVSIEYHPELDAEFRACLDRLAAIGPVRFNCTVGDATEFLLPEWSDGAALRERLSRLGGGSVWGDIYARFECGGAA
jgi:FkbM family methyltransferase